MLLFALKDVTLKLLNVGLIMRSLKIFLLSAVVLMPAIYAQQETAKSDNEIINSAVSRLQQKVLLDDKQAANINSLLIRNISSLTDASTRNAALEQAKAKVELMLDARQKAKYEIIKEDWWGKLSKEIALAASD